MELKTTNRQQVEEVSWGMYVWQTPDGEFLGDSDGNVMNVFCEKGNRKAMEALSDAARHYGHPEGKPVWWSGKRRINDEELAEQEMRAKLGLVADPLDIGAIRDEMRAKRVNV
jgi:hypothetical protein